MQGCGGGKQAERSRECYGSFWHEDAEGWRMNG